MIIGIKDRQIIDRNIIDRKMGKDRFSQETDDSFFHDQPPQAEVGASKHPNHMVSSCRIYTAWFSYTAKPGGLWLH